MSGWVKDAAARRQDAQVYGPAYRRNRAIIIRQANGWCAQCGRRYDRLECDHITPGAGYALSNLQALCKACHDQKTYDERGGKVSDPEPIARTTW